MNKKKLYIGLGVLAIVGIGGFLIYNRRKAKSKENPSFVPKSEDFFKKEPTSFMVSPAMEKIIKIANERGIGGGILNKRVS